MFRIRSAVVSLVLLVSAGCGQDAQVNPENRGAPKLATQEEVDQLWENPNVPNDAMNTVCWIVREITSEYFAWLAGQGRDLNLIDSKGLTMRLESVRGDLPANVLPFADRLDTELRELDIKQRNADGERLENYLIFFEGFDFEDWPAQEEYLSAASDARCATAV